ncbi:MAG: hypothetical protein HY445_01160 [Candidatus Niyogibacteria bacterium]|nr:hypothetical protein [Candidatus Niyogibacteria bacterium]
MSREIPQKATSQEIPVASIVSAETIERGILSLLNASPQNKKAETLVSKLSTVFSGIPEDKAAKLENIFEELRVTSTESEEDLAHAATTKLYAFITENFTAQEIEARIRSAFVEQGGFIPLNEILSYGIYRNEAHIHLAPARTKPVRETTELIKQGLSELARKITSDKELRDIDLITATSWIVAKHPKTMERLGFTTEGPITDEMKREHFADETRDVSKCYMSKEELLRLYS